MKNSRRIALLPLLIGMFSIADAHATQYWVSKSGSDSHSCTNDTTDACLTIQKGVSLLKAGDTLSVKAGTYADDGGASAYAPKGAFCGWLDSLPASANVCVGSNGTASAPIVIQAAAGDEGKVVLDAQSRRVGIHLQTSDYVTVRGFKIINAYGQGICSWGQAENAVADPTRLSVGVIVENNSITNTTGPWGANTAGIGMWSTKDWIVRNNLIDGVTADGGSQGSGMQSYGLINALVEHNKILNVGYGIYWKDHFILDSARNPVTESEIRYNEISSSSRGLNIGIMGQNSEEAGNSYFHHNIIYGFGNEAAGIHIALAGAGGIGGTMRIENNLLDGNNNSSSFGISVDSSRGVYMRGNIIMRTSLDAEIITYSDAGAKIPHVLAQDYNVYDSTFSLIADRYSSASKAYSTLSGWQSVLNSLLTSLDIDRPDLNSKSVAYTSLVQNADAHNYKYTSTSPALKMMADGSNAGPYQTGNEVIGLLAGWPSYSGTPTSPAPTTPAPASAPVITNIQVVP